VKFPGLLGTSAFTGPTSNGRFTSISGHTEAALPGDRPPSLFSRHATAAFAPDLGSAMRVAGLARLETRAALPTATGHCLILRHERSPLFKADSATLTSAHGRVRRSHPQG
jgi:hypothetical protein